MKYDQLVTATKILAIFLLFFLFLWSITVNSDISSIVIILVTLFVFLFLFFPIKIETHRNFMAALLLIIISGTLLRLWLASRDLGNFDMINFTIVSDFVLKGLNVYHYTTRYNYSPLWSIILGFLRIFSNSIFLRFQFAVSGFLTTIYFLTLVLLLTIGKLEGLSETGLIRLSLLFYLNPISYMITGYSGQFENVALFFVVLGLFIYLKYKDVSQSAKYLSWLSFSVGLIVKHDTVMLVLTGIINLFKKAKYIAFFFIATIALFLVTFIFYWSTGSRGIIDHVFLYSSALGWYGVSLFWDFPYLKYLFVVGLLIYPLLIKDREIVEQFLLGSIFFITFTTGLFVQYFILPVVFGALRPSKWFMFYIIAASLLILDGTPYLSLPGLYSVFSVAVWICALFWFVFTHFDLKEFEGRLLNLGLSVARSRFVQKNIIALFLVELIVVGTTGGVIFYIESIKDRNAAPDMRDAYYNSVASINFDYMNTSPPANANASAYRMWLNDFLDKQRIALNTYSDISVNGNRYSTYLNKTSSEYQQIKDNITFFKKMSQTSQSLSIVYEEQYMEIINREQQPPTNTPTFIPIQLVNENNADYQKYRDDLEAIEDAQSAIRIVQSDYSSDLQYVDGNQLKINEITRGYYDTKKYDEGILNAAQIQAAADLAEAQGKGVMNATITPAVREEATL